VDFDQQTYEPALEVYRPHLFPDNKPVDELVREHLNVPTIVQYRQEERAQTARRIQAEERRYQALISTLRKTPIAPEEHVAALAAELDQYHRCSEFAGSANMGDLLVNHLERMLSDAVHA